MCECVCLCSGAGDGQPASTGLMVDMKVNKGSSCSVSRPHSVPRPTVSVPCQFWNLTVYQKPPEEGEHHRFQAPQPEVLSQPAGHEPWKPASLTQVPGDSEAGVLSYSSWICQDLSFSRTVLQGL